jgi:hypothetical protein
MGKEKKEEIESELEALEKQRNESIGKLKEALEKPEFTKPKEFHRQMEVIQNFYSTRAVAHASFFVASIFGLFTILALMESSFQKLSNYWSWIALGLLSITYWGVFVIGLHSFLKFGRYSIYAQIAARLTSGQADDWILDSKLVEDNIRAEYTIGAKVMKWVKATKLARAMKRTKTTRRTNSLKLNEWFSRHNKDVYKWSYFGISISAFFAFLIIILLRNHFL